MDYLAAFGCVGAQLMLTERFGFFADVGFEFRMATSSEADYDDAGDIIAQDWSYQEQFGTRSVYLGAIFYLVARE